MAFYSVGVSLIPGTSDPRYFDVAVTGSPGSDAGARRTWHCRKRYNDFLRCKKSLKALGVRVAAFPPKITKFGLPVSGSNDLEKRRAKLENWLSAVLRKSGGQHDMAVAEVVNGFIEANRYYTTRNNTAALAPAAAISTTGDYRGSQSVQSVDAGTGSGVGGQSMRRVALTVPLGTRAGAAITAIVDGKMMRFTCPHGLSGGALFAADVPAADIAAAPLPRSAGKAAGAPPSPGDRRGVKVDGSNPFDT